MSNKYHTASSGHSCLNLEVEEEHEHDNTELAEVAIQQPPEISELLKSLTSGIEKLIAQTLKVQEPPARPGQLSQEPGPSNDQRFTTCENSASPGRHATCGQQADANAVELRKFALRLPHRSNVIKVVQVISRQIIYIQASSLPKVSPS